MWYRLVLGRLCLQALHDFKVFQDVELEHLLQNTAIDWNQESVLNVHLLQNSICWNVYNIWWRNTLIGTPYLYLCWQYSEVCKRKFTWTSFIRRSHKRIVIHICLIALRLQRMLNSFSFPFVARIVSMKHPPVFQPMWNCRYLAYIRKISSRNKDGKDESEQFHCFIIRRK